MVLSGEFISQTLIFFTMLKAVFSFDNCSTNHDCRPWFSCSDDHQCQCGEYSHQIVECNVTSAVLDCYCVTYDANTDTTVAGACFTNCGRNLNTDNIYLPLPKNISSLNSFMCGHLKRTGTLCGQCMEGHSPLAYSFNLTCIKCPEGHKNWWKFILVGFFPLTVFYLFILAFKVNVTSSNLTVVVFYSQIITMPTHLRVVFFILNNYNPAVLIAAKILASIYGIWNLDFFRTLIPNICLNTSPLHTLVLDYAIAVYPLALIIITIVMIKLYDGGYKCVVFMWRPFRIILGIFHKNWEIRTSVIDVFATFLLLSYVKILSVSFDILIPTNLYTTNSSKYKLQLYYDASVAYFGKDHLTLAVPAIFMLTFFNIIPTIILLLYQCQCFHKILNRFPINWQILHTFADSFQGSYKDGTEPGTRDCRWFATLFLVLRIFVLLIYSTTHSSAFFPLAGLLFILILTLLIMFQPFKSRVSHYTKIYTMFLTLLLLYDFSICGIIITISKAHYLTYFFVITTIIATIIPFIYTTWIVSHWIFSHRKWGMEIFQRFRAWKQGYDWSKLHSET